MSAIAEDMNVQLEGLPLPLLALVITLAVAVGLFIACGITYFMIDEGCWGRAQTDIETAQAHDIAHLSGRLIYEAGQYELACPLTPILSNDTTLVGDGPNKVKGASEPMRSVTITMPSAAAIARYHKARSGTRAATHKVFDRSAA